MRSLVPILFMMVMTVAAAHVLAQDSSKSTTDGCRVIERPAAAPQSGQDADTMSSTVTAGGGRVSGSTTGGSTTGPGSSVTVQSGGTGTGSSSSVASSSGSGGTTVVTGSGTGDCVIYVNPGDKPK